MHAALARRGEHADPNPTPNPYPNPNPNPNPNPYPYPNPNPNANPNPNPNPNPNKASTLRENPKTYKLACITNVCTLGHAFEPSCTQAHAPPAPRVSPEALP